MTQRPTHLAIAEDFILYSDGGGDRDIAGGAACIVDYPRKSLRLKYIALTGGATNNEAEILAGLLGFAVLKTLRAAGEISGKHLRWVADSEYVLKSATDYIKVWQVNGWKTAAKKPVKNQGLWRAYLDLSQEFDVRPSHIRGHTGHTENEACDEAATWAQQNAATLLNESGGPLWEVNVSRVEIGRNWMAIDCQKFLQDLRDEQPAEQVVAELVHRLGSNPTARIAAGPSSAGGTAEKNENALFERMKELERIASKLNRSSSEHAELVRELSDLVTRFKKP